MGKILNWIFQTDATIESNFDVQQKCRGQIYLSYRWRSILNPLSEFRVKLKIISFTIRNVLECMENVWEKVLNLIFHTDAIIKCKFEVTSKLKSSMRPILSLKTMFQSIMWVSRKIINKTFHYTQCIKMYWKCMKQIFKWIIHTDVIIECKFDVNQRVRVQWGLSYRRKAFFNPLSEFRDNLKI